MKKTNVSILLSVIIFLSWAGWAFADNTPFYQSETSIKPGMSGDLVTSLQSYLAGLGIYPKNDITGYFGSLTETAVKLFQIKSSISPTGIVGSQTKFKIITLIAASLPPSSRESSSSSELDANVLISDASTTDLSGYSVHPRPQYDLIKLAKDIQDEVNEQRASAGLNPIYWDDQLATVAQEHSDDQAKDNIPLTDPSLVCEYPIIRHEGLNPDNFSLKDRFTLSNISYKYGGENIAMIPVSKNLLYLHMNSEPLAGCKQVEDFEPAPGTEPERTALYDKIIKESEDAVSGLTPVTWVNKEWRTPEELVKVTVDGWMNSPGHRENILRKEFTIGGIGITPVNDYIIITHDFVGR